MQCSVRLSSSNALQPGFDQSGNHAVMDGLGTRTSSRKGGLGFGLWLNMHICDQDGETVTDNALTSSSRNVLINKHGYPARARRSPPAQQEPMFWAGVSKASLNRTLKSTVVILESLESLKGSDRTGAKRDKL